MKRYFLLFVICILAACNNNSEDLSTVSPLYLPKEINLQHYVSATTANNPSKTLSRIFSDENTDYSRTQSRIIEDSGFVESFLTFPNMFLCVMDQLHVYDNVNKGTYEASGDDIDEDACAKNPNDANESEPNENITFNRLVIRSTRANNTAPHEIYILFNITGKLEDIEINSQTVLHLSITKGVSEATPFGVFTYDTFNQRPENDELITTKQRFAINQVGTDIDLSLTAESNNLQNLQFRILISTLENRNINAKVKLTSFNEDKNSISASTLLESIDSRFRLATGYFTEDNYNSDDLTCNAINQVVKTIYSYYLFDTETGSLVSVTPDGKSYIVLNYSHSHENDINNTGLFHGEEFTLRFHQFDTSAHGYLFGMPDEELYLKPGTLLGTNDEYVLKPNFIWEEAQTVQIEECHELNIEHADKLDLLSLDNLTPEFTLTLDDAPKLP